MSGASTDRRREPLSAAERRAVAAIVVVGALLRIAWFVATKGEPPTDWVVQGDQYGYYFYGREIAEGGGYTNYLTGEPTAYYPVGYPLLLAGLFFVALHTPVTDDLLLVAGVVHVVMSVATVWFTFVVGRRLLGPGAGLLAAAVLALWPNMVFQVSSLQLETSFLFFTMGAVAVAVDHDWRAGPASRRRMLAFGGLLAASALIRPFSVWVLVGLAAAAFGVAGGRRNWRASGRVVATTLVWPVLVLLVVFAPWTMRNMAELDAFVPTSTNTGDGLCIDRDLEATGAFRWADHEYCADPALGEVERNRESTRLALEFVREHPGRELLQIGRRARAAMTSDIDGLEAVDDLGPSFDQLDDGAFDRYADVANGYFRVVLWLALPGLVLAWVRSPRPERWITGSMFVGLLLIPLLLYGNPRFHVPLAPFAAIAAAATVTSLIAVLAGARAGSPARRTLAAE